VYFKTRRLPPSFSSDLFQCSSPPFFFSIFLSSQALSQVPFSCSISRSPFCGLIESLLTLNSKAYCFLKPMIRLSLRRTQLACRPRCFLLWLPLTKTLRTHFRRVPERNCFLTPALSIFREGPPSLIENAPRWFSWYCSLLPPNVC